MGGSLRFQMNEEVIETVSIFRKVAKYHPKFSNNIFLQNSKRIHFASRPCENTEGMQS